MKQYLYIYIEFGPHGNVALISGMLNYIMDINLWLCVMYKRAVVIACRRHSDNYTRHGLSCSNMMSSFLLEPRAHITSASCRAPL